MTLIKEVYDLAWDMYSDSETLRWGQCCFNALYMIDPELANQITGTDIDPFYAPPQDESIAKFWEFVEKNS